MSAIGLDYTDRIEPMSKELKP